jgi:amino acid transporter
MQLAITLAALALGLALVGSMAFLQHRPKQKLDASMIPSTPLMIIGAFITLLALVHLVNLWGIHTGR